MRHVGFSTGALAKGDFRRALRMLRNERVDSIELSALRLSEVEELVRAIPDLDLHRFFWKSFHAPSGFSADEEGPLAQLLFESIPEDWPIILHPDTIFDFSYWRPFGSRIAIENMDRRKSCGRSAKEIAEIFSLLPDASLCFDIGHARQFDSTMTEAYFLLVEFKSKLVQVHVSEVNSASHHEKISYAATLAFEEVRSLLPCEVPLILESRVSADEIAQELSTVAEVFGR